MTAWIAVWRRWLHGESRNGRAYADRGDAFRMPRSDSDDPAQIVKEMGQDGWTVRKTRAVGRDGMTGEKIALDVPAYDGRDYMTVRPFFDGAGKSFIRINPSGIVRRDVDGVRAYQIGMAWAINNRIPIMPDYAGLTEINWLRRSEAQISTMLKYGERALIVEPDASQYIGLLGKKDYDVLAGSGTYARTERVEQSGTVEHRLEQLKRRLWLDPQDYPAMDRDSIFRYNLSNLIAASAALASRRSALVWQVTYANGQFFHHGNRVDDTALATVVSAARSFDVGVGRTTLSRAAITKAVLSELDARDLGANVAPGRLPDLPARDAVLAPRSPWRIENARRAAAAAVGAPGHLLYSRAKGGGSTVENIEAEIRAEIGSAKAKKVRVVRTWRDLPTRGRELVFSRQAFDVQGWFDPETGDFTLVAENIRPGRGFAVLMHEVGVHMGLRPFIGADNFDKLAAQITEWATFGVGEHGKLAKIAAARVPKDTPKGQRKEELVAYFVEEAVKAGHGWHRPNARGAIAAWFRNLLRAIATALSKLGIKPGTLSVDDVLALARGALETALSGHKPDDPRGGGKLSQSAPPFRSELQAKVEALPQESATSLQWKGTIEGLKGVKRDEIEWSGVLD
ncbi:MAG: hypothetical protein ACT4P4_00795, partial [Betaproteobacteria bacterium]